MEYKDFFKDKVVLITGGTGFIGRKIVNRILQYEPQSIRLFSRDEVKHFKAKNYFQDHPSLRYLIGDVRDYNRLRKALKGVDIVIHAAALKRLDILEYNVEESIQTNILGTLNVARACWDENVNKAIFISTDKACSPVNTYGACKFIGERIFTESNYNKGKQKTSFVSVRYGNVLDSTESIIPSLTKRIIEDQPLLLTDERMTRFLITPDRAVELILKAIKYGQGGEVFVPDLCSFKITDLIDVLKGHYNKELPTTIIGIRPGEKIHEILINEPESVRTHIYEGCYVVKSNIEKHNANLSTNQYLNLAPIVETKELSSKDFLISKEELYQQLKEEKLVD